MGWWPDAYAGWWHQQAATAAQGAVGAQQGVGFKSKHSRAQAAVPAKTTASVKPVGLSFNELEQRLNRSWEDLVSKETQQFLEEAPTEVAMPLPARLVATPSSPRDESRDDALDHSQPATLPPAPGLSAPEEAKAGIASIFCPLCAEQGGTCPFHTASCWASGCGEATSSSPQLVCEAPPPSHIAHAMVDQILDTEDASTEAGSTASWRGSGSRSDTSPASDHNLEADDWSDPGDAHVSAALRQEGSTWWSRRSDASTPEGERREDWPALSQSRHDGSSIEAEDVDSDALRQILAMGFPEAAARSALAHAGGRGVDAAVAVLIDGVAA